MSTVDVGITFLEKTYKDVDRLIVDQELSPRELVAIIRRASSNILMKVRMERTYKTDYDFITFNAYHANWLDIPITILFIIHKDQKTIKLNEVEWRDIKVHLISVILHEFKHDEQFSKRGVDMRAVYEKEIKGARQEYFFDAL